MNTIGEKRVRVEFNPSKDGVVDQIKQKSAELINLINELSPFDLNSKVTMDAAMSTIEKERLISNALTDIEQGCMWAVKAATLKD